MADKKGTAVLIVTIYDIPPEGEEDFNGWYNEEHLVENMENPEYLSVGRYFPVGKGAQHMTCYELESSDSSTWRERVNRPKGPASEWQKRAFVGKVVINNIYKQIFPAEVSAETKQSGRAPFLAIEIMEVPDEVENEFNQWYNTIYLPRMETTPGLIRGRRYTATRGEPKYATVYELEDEKAYDRARSAAASDANPQTTQMLPKLKYANDFPCVFRMHFEMQQP